MKKIKKSKRKSKGNRCKSCGGPLIKKTFNDFKRCYTPSCKLYNKEQK